MVAFEFLKQVDNLIYYVYYPEGNKQSGQVSISVDGEIWNIEKLSKDDFSNYYASHVLSYVSREIEAGNDIPKSGMVAWY